MDERDPAIRGADIFPTLHQILNERNPRMVDLLDEQRRMKAEIHSQAAFPRHVK